MADSVEQSEKPTVACEGASGVAGEVQQDSGSQLEAVHEEESSVASQEESAASSQAETPKDEASTCSEGQSPTKNKKVSFNPTPILISDSEKEWDSSSSKGTSSDTQSSDSSGPGASHHSPSAQLAALHFKSREFLESQRLSDFTSDETSGDSEASDPADALPEVSSDELERLKTHKLCRGREELREMDIEFLRKSFSFVKCKLEACLRRTLVRCSKEMSAFDDMTKDLMSSFRDLFVILCIRLPLAERNYNKILDIGTKLVAKITAKGLSAFNKKFLASVPSSRGSAIQSWYESAQQVVLTELSDMENEPELSEESASASASGSASASN